MDHMDLDATALSGESSGASAASRVQGIIDAAEATAAEIVSDAKLQADHHIQDAKRAAELIRAEAITAAEEHLAAVQQATASLRSSIGSASSIPHEKSSGESRSEPPAEHRSSVERAREPAAEEPPRSTDLDGARLVALNMALAGDARETIDRYLAEHFDLSQRTQLIDEVCDAIEG